LQIDGKRMVVVGLGKSGVSCARFLSRRGAHVTVTDASPRERVADAAREMDRMGVELVLGGHPESVFHAADAIVVSPGVPHDLPGIQAARERSIPVIGEIELAARFIAVPILAISGTNGKTTVTHLAADMLRASGKRVWMGGNIGNPLMDYLSETQPAECDSRVRTATADVKIHPLHADLAPQRIRKHLRISLRAPNRNRRAFRMQEHVHARRTDGDDIIPRRLPHHILGGMLL